MIWQYQMSLMAFLLFGWQFQGYVTGNSKSEARSNLKKKLGQNLPPGTTLKERPDLFEYEGRLYIWENGDAKPCSAGSRGVDFAVS